MTDKNTSHQEVWGAVAERWAALSAQAKQEYFEPVLPFLNILNRHMPEIKAATVLEPGCGTAMLSAHLAKSWGARCVCLDFTPAMLAQARERFHAENVKADFILGDITRIPFKNGVFDLVLNEGVLEHIPRPERQLAINEMARVASGFVGIFVANAWDPVRMIAKLVMRVQGRFRRRQELPYSRWRLEQSLEQAGLRVTKKSGVNFFRLWYSYWPFRVLLRPVLRRFFANPLDRMNCSDSFLNRYFGATIFQLGVKWKGEVLTR